MANGIGKIALGRKQAQTSWAQGTSRAPLISHRMGTKKRQQDSAYRNSILSSLGSIASGFKENTEAWGKYEAGAKATGIDVGEASFGDKLLRGFGLKNVDLAKKHQTSEGMWEYSGSELMSIGEKSQTGTLESFLGDKKIGDLYGGASKELQAYQYKGESGTGLSAMDKGQDFQDFRKGLSGQIDFKTQYDDPSAPGYVKRIEKNKPYNEQTKGLLDAAESGEHLYQNADIFRLSESYHLVTQNKKPFKNFKADKVKKLADDPEFTKILYFTPSHLDHLFSKRSTFFDCVKILFLAFNNLMAAFMSALVKLLCIKG